MKRFIVVSSNNNADYLFYAPYVEKAWNNYGWNVAFMITHDVDPKDLKLNNTESLIIQLPHIEGLRIETVAQASRLYAANYLPLDALIMTSDMDLIPLSNYWNPNPEEITVYGHDLTDYSYYPMGYVAMTGHKWREVFKLTYNTLEDMLQGARETGLPYKENWEQWWNHDWRLLTDKLSPLKDQIKFITRGRRTVQPHKGVFAFGRVDRGDSCQVPNENLIDIHCENKSTQHPDKLSKFLSIYEPIHGKP
jgi:hypothetical protein